MSVQCSLLRMVLSSRWILYKRQLVVMGTGQEYGIASMRYCKLASLGSLWWAFLSARDIDSIFLGTSPLGSISRLRFKSDMTSNVIAGEGAESDDDDAQAPSFMKNTMISSTMVSGEASETDEEDEEDVEEHKSPYNAPMTADTLHLDVQGAVALSTTLDEAEDPNSSSVSTKKVEKAKRHKLVYKYDSPFHRKLREKNLQLRSGVVEGATQMYKASTLRLKSSAFHLSRAQAAVQEVAHNSKIILEDLHSLIHILRNTEQINTLSNIKMSH